MKTLILALAFSVSFAHAAPKEKYLTLSKMKTVTVSPGATAEAVFAIKVNPGFHVQANPASGPNLIATTLEVAPASGIEVGQPVYPEGKPYKLQGSATEINAWEGAFEIKLPVTAKADAKAGKQTLKGTLRYQACDDKICFFPIKLPVTVPVQVTAPKG